MHLGWEQLNLTKLQFNCQSSYQWESSRKRMTLDVLYCAVQIHNCALVCADQLYSQIFANSFFQANNFFLLCPWKLVLWTQHKQEKLVKCKGMQENDFGEARNVFRGVKAAENQHWMSFVNLQRFCKVILLSVDGSCSLFTTYAPNRSREPESKSRTSCFKAYTALAVLRWNADW